MKRILILNGPNLNLLGEREPHLYGSQTLSDIEALCHETAQAHGYETDCRQTNSEGVLVDWIQECRSGFAGLVLNAAAYTHTSIAIYDALKMLSCPVIEVHLSNPHSRESFRHHSYVSPVASGIVAGFGAEGYRLAIMGLVSRVERQTTCS